METLPSELYNEIIKFVDDQNIRLVNDQFKKSYDFCCSENGVNLTITKSMFLKYATKVKDFTARENVLCPGYLLKTWLF
jgi:hypothetical protein